MVRCCLLLCCLPVLAGPVSGRVTDGSRGIPGVRVYPDRTVRVRPKSGPPCALTGADGRFTLDLGPEDTVLAMEKPGLARDLVPVRELSAPVVLRPAANYRRERVVVVRLAFPGRPPLRDDAELRALLFGRGPGAASAANYFYEISKGSLELEEGAFLHLDAAPPPGPQGDGQRPGLVRWVLERIRGLDRRPFDRVNNRTGAPAPDGKPDHLWIIAPGPAFSVTNDPADFTPVCALMALPWRRAVRWPVVFFPEESPLGCIVHEALHAQGEWRVDDLYLDDPRTAGPWDVMDAGQFRGWDRSHPETFPWQEDTAYSPSAPMGWVRGELWYWGAFRATVPTLEVGRAWEGWMDPLARAPRAGPQRLVIPDPRRRGRFWELNVRRPWGFDRGRVGGRWGPGHEGLVVARVDPSRLSRGRPRGPVRVVDAHPDTPEPPRPRYPGGRWQLEDAAFNLGPGEVPSGADGPLHWEVLEVDGSGRMRIRVRLDSRPTKNTIN